MTVFETFKIWYAKSLSNNKFSQADGNIKVRDFSSPIKQSVQLIYVIPSQFRKRETDVSEALAVDPSSPDTGTAMSDVIVRFVQKREEALSTSVLPLLLNMFYVKSSDKDFEKGRIGLESSDNPDLDCLPVKLAGYKFKGFKQEPNQDKTALQTWEVTLKFLGDHSKLGTRE